MQFKKQSAHYFERVKKLWLVLEELKIFNMTIIYYFRTFGTIIPKGYKLMQLLHKITRRQKTINKQKHRQTLF